MYIIWKLNCCHPVLDAWAHSCSVSDAYCCCFSYHTLLDLCYQHWAEKTTAAKKLWAEKGISVREAEWRLDANIFLDEIPRWEPSEPHHPYLYQRMFAHAEATGQKEYDCRVCWGHRQPLSERDVQVEVPAMKLITCNTTWEEIMGLYHQVYQLKGNPRAVPRFEETTEEIHIEILEMLKEHLQHRQSPTQSEEELRQMSMGTRFSRMPAQAQFHDYTQVTYDHFGHFWDRQQESHEEALRMARDAHHQVLVAAALLEGHIERLGHSVTWGWSHSQGW